MTQDGKLSDTIKLRGDECVNFTHQLLLLDASDIITGLHIGTGTSRVATSDEAYNIRMWTNLVNRILVGNQDPEIIYSLFTLLESLKSENDDLTRAREAFFRALRNIRESLLLLKKAEYDTHPINVAKNFSDRASTVTGITN